MENEPGTQPSAPRGHKLVAWEGVGLFVPDRWDMGRHAGDRRQGSFRVDSEQRVVVQVKWWTARQPVSFDHVLAQHARLLAGPRPGDAAPGFRKVCGLALPDGPQDRAVAFETPESAPDGGEWVVIWQSARAERVAVFRFIVEDGQPDRACREAMLAGLRLRSADEWRDWAAFDFALRSPPAFSLNKAVLSAGVCYLRFRHGRDFIALRRFSAADAVIGAVRKSPDGQKEPPLALGDLETWSRLVYAAEFHDMRYQVEEATDPSGRPMLRLSGKRRLLSPIELKWLIPEHRRLPTRIDVLWDPDANKVYCVEVRNPKGGLEPVIEEFERRLSMTLESVARLPEPPTGTRNWSELPENRRNRQRSLQARVGRSPEIESRQAEPGRTVITYPYARPRGLRLLRLLGGQPAGGKTAEKHLELDLIGSFVWQRCDGKSRVCDLVEAVRERFRISYREAELSVAHFVRDLGSRGILALEMPDEED